MKTLILSLALMITITGCSLPLYDNNEYELLSRLETTVTLINENCSDEEVVKSYLPTLEYDSRLLHTYSFYIPQNTNTYEMVDILKGDIVEFMNQYKKGEATPFYCKMKTQLFTNKVRIALDAVGNKLRK